MGASAEERGRGPLIRRAGDRALLVELDPAVSAAHLHAAAAAVGALPAVARCTPGHSSLFVVLAKSLERGDLESAIAKARAEDLGGVTHELRVDFSDASAPDLSLLLDRAGISRGEFLERFASITFTARYLGFRPGFAYLDGVPEEWQLPRRETPRPAVPAGTFAFAGAMAAFYPSQSPGGWNLLGRTDAALWDPARRPPNLIAPGDGVRVVPAR